MAVDIGQKVRVFLGVSDLDGNPANTNLAVAVTRGDFTAAPAPAVVNTGVGSYHFDVATTVAGPWVWVATGTVPVEFAKSGQFFVRSSGARLLSLDEAKRYLNKDLIITTDDDEILDLVDTATTLIEEIVGAVMPRTIVEVYNGGRSAIYLRQRARSITSILEAQAVGTIVTLTADVAGVSAANDGYVFDSSANVIYRTSGGGRMRFQGGVNAITITYVGGRLVTPPNFRTAAGELLSHVWRTSQYARGTTRPRTNEPDTTVVMGYAIPNRVMELLGKSKRAPRLGQS